MQGGRVNEEPGRLAMLGRRRARWSVARLGMATVLPSVLLVGSCGLLIRTNRLIAEEQRRVIPQQDYYDVLVAPATPEIVSTGRRLLVAQWVVLLVVPVIPIVVSPSTSRLRKGAVLRIYAGMAVLVTVGCLALAALTGLI
jgi:hypothetical protein